ncbi:family 9 polysaccharide lyase [Emericellopsis cladophorae]|uniref:Family 9 polysaccharide lyase n=1 Tax=Emericellopsis cladophorae TaxID=2686198 RepID=A0A9P9XYY4_9HYPO|nr:family 9 polysaccharide lyase [Emericellopsis cladophorae]KAI6780459.1 family 9 polysaccharide lyase [Emericellopsis cladophorae]
MHRVSCKPSILLAIVASAGARDIFVAPSGSGSGSIDAPFGFIQDAVDEAVAGDVIYLRQGTFAPSANIQIGKSGSRTSPISIRPYGSEKVIVNGENMPGLINGPYGIYARDASHNYYEGLSTHDNYETGFQLEGASSNNTVINLDSYMNRDPRKNGESADGFACKSGQGEGNVLRNARLWNNVDDGLDLYMFASPVTLEEVYAWGNGYNRWGFSPFEGDGNGFKLGISGNPPTDHVVRNSIAYKNYKKGFIDNGNPGSITFERNTAWKNGDTGFVMRSSSSDMRKNLAVNNSNGQAQLIGAVDSSGNSWDSNDNWSDSDFHQRRRAIASLWKQNHL